LHSTRFDVCLEVAAADTVRGSPSFPSQDPIACLVQRFGHSLTPCCANPGPLRRHFLPPGESDRHGPLHAWTGPQPLVNWHVRIYLFECTVRLVMPRPLLELFLQPGALCIIRSVLNTMQVGVTFVLMDSGRIPRRESHRLFYPVDPLAGLGFPLRIFFSEGAFPTPPSQLSPAAPEATKHQSKCRLFILLVAGKLGGSGSGTRLAPRCMHIGCSAGCHTWAFSVHARWCGPSVFRP
jgi:hypothetical protein